jgi:hypothetical protein
LHQHEPDDQPDGQRRAKPPHEAVIR